MHTERRALVSNSIRNKTVRVSVLVGFLVIIIVRIVRYRVVKSQGQDSLFSKQLRGDRVATNVVG